MDIFSRFGRVFSSKSEGGIVVSAASAAVAPAAQKSTGPGASAMIKVSSSDRLWEDLDSRLFPRDVADILTDANSGDLRRQDELFARMEDSWPHLAKCMRELKKTIARVPYTVTAYAEKDKEPTPLAVEKAALVEKAIWSMSPRAHYLESDLEGTIENVADAIGKAVSVQEIYWHQTPDGILPRCTKRIPSNYYGFPTRNDVEDRLMLNPSGMRQSLDTLIDFPENKFIVGIYNHRSGHPTKTAMLRVLARLWIMRVYSEKWLASYAEVFGQPFRWATYDPTQANLLTEITAMLENMGSSGWGAFPIGTTLELKEPARGAAENPQRLIQTIADNAAAILVLGQTLTTDVGASGSRALGETHQSVRFDVLKECADWTARTIQRQLAAAIVAVNFGDTEEIPVIGHPLKEAKDEKSMAERDKILIGDLGVEVEKAWLYERHGIPQPDKASPDAIFRPAQKAPAATDSQTPNNQAERGIGKVQARESTNSTVLVEARRRAEVSRLAENVAESVSGVSARWLGPVKPIFAELVAKAADKTISDADFIAAVKATSAKMPELFAELNTDALADAMEAAMGASVANGAVRGELDRKGDL